MEQLFVRGQNSGNLGVWVLWDINRIASIAKMMIADDDDDVEVQKKVYQNDIDKSGYLQKKTSKGLWVARYFATDSRSLRYWHEREQFDKAQPACEEFDLAEVSAVEKCDQKGCKVKFLKNTKFQLQLKAETEAEMNEWIEIIRAKIKLYSVDELLADLVGERVSFRTKTFQTLLLLSEKEQNKWILNRLDEAFESGSDDQHVLQLRSNPAHLLKATCRAFDEFLEVCIECKQEMTSRSPRIIAHSRNYILRYTDILKGRTMLELLYIPGIENKRFEVMGEQALCCALELTQKIEDMKQYTFVPKTFLATLASSLFTFGDLLSALLNLSLRRVDSFFEVLVTLPPELHSRKLSEGTQLISEFMQLVKEDLKTDFLFRLVMDKAITSLLLAFNDYFLAWDTSSHNETLFINHVQACDKLQVSAARTYIDLAQRKFVVSETDLVVTADQPILTISPAVQDAVRSTCSSSAYRAVSQSVLRLQESKQYLLQGLLNEQNMVWINGSLCAAFINNLDQWSSFICSALPERFTFMVYLQVARLMVHMYIANMIDRHKEKKRMVSTERGVRQIAQDLMAIKSWISTYEKDANAVTEQHVIVVLQSFLLCSQRDMVQAFSEAILLFGIKYAYHAYDLLRLCLKFRPEISDIDRKAVLGLCCEFIHAVQKAMDADGFSFSLPTQDMTMLDMLLPKVGIEHCTGFKWKLCTLSDPAAVQMTLAVIVAETCNKAMASRKKREDRTAYQSRAIMANSFLPASQKHVPAATAQSSGDNTPEAAEASPEPRLSQRPLPPPPPPRRRATIGPPDSSPIETKPSADAVAALRESVRPLPPPPPPRPPQYGSPKVDDAVAPVPVPKPMPAIAVPVETAASVPFEKDNEDEQSPAVTPPAPLIKQSPAPPPKPARRLTAPPSQMQSSQSEAVGGASGRLTGAGGTSPVRSLTPHEALQLMLDAAKKSVAASTSAEDEEGH